MIETIANDNAEVMAPEKRAVRQFLDDYLRPVGEIDIKREALAHWYETLRAENQWPEISPILLMRLLAEMGCTVRSKLCLPTAEMH